MTATELTELIERGHEQPGVEFKPPCVRTKESFPKVARAILGMSNRRDGGLVVIGVSETPTKQLHKAGLTEEQAASWAYDHVASSLAPYADPSVSLDVSRVMLEGKLFVVIQVGEFAEVPVLCRKSFQKGEVVVLREGACYVRSRRKVETVEVSSYEDMRDLIDLATDKSLRSFIARAHAAGLSIGREEQPSSADLYDEERGDFR